jgi:hypothetical protein
VTDTPSEYKNTWLGWAFFFSPYRAPEVLKRNLRNLCNLRILFGFSPRPLCLCGEILALLHHRAEPADDFGQASCDLAEGTMFDAVDEFGEGVAALLHNGSEPV